MSRSADSAIGGRDVARLKEPPAGEGTGSMVERSSWLPPALSKPRFRLYTCGHAVSVLGGWIQQVALSWLVFRLTKSVFLLGLTGFLLQISYLLFGAIAGMAVDRLPRLKLLLAIDAFLALLSLVMALMVASGIEDVRVYLGLAAIIGIANAFEMPARQSLFSEIVGDRALIPSAIAMSGVIFNAGRMVGPALAGLLLLYVSESWCFAFNALSYFAIIAALIAMRLPSSATTMTKGSTAVGLIDGIAFLCGQTTVRYLLPLMIVVGLCATPYVSLMPSITATFFGGSSATLGILMSAAGLGALLGAGTLAMQQQPGLQMRVVAIVPALLGAAVIGFGLSRSLAVSCGLLAVVGGGIMLMSASVNTLIQQSVPEEWRGRAIGLYATAFQGAAPIGHLLAGSAAAHFGLPVTLATGGAAILVAAFVFRWQFTHHPQAIRTMRRALGH